MSLKPASDTWQEIRLFISSTFRDMQAERDYLVRFVFPRVREELLRYHIYFIDVDLRWGITDEDNIVGACRSIIDECHPLFLGILGGRYGWVPGEVEDAVSVTEEEIDHAINNYKKSGYQHLMFLLRNENDTLSMKEAVQGEFREPEGSIAAKRLALLKNKILQSDFFVSEYHARWDDELHSLSNLQAFGETVYQYIHDYVAHEFDLWTEYNGGPYDVDEADLELYITQRNKFYILNGLEEPFQSLETLAKTRRESNVILVSGSGGIGKSSFLCRYIQQCRQQNELTVLPHFVGVTPNSAELSGVLAGLCRRLLRYNPLNDPIPIEIDRLILFFQMLLLQLNKDEKYVLIIDGINQMQQDNGALELHWLPLQLPENITLILSTATEEVAHTIRSRWPELNEIRLQGLNTDASRLLISYYLERYQKKLTEGQIAILLSKESTHVPLYLATVIEELRIYGSYEELTDFLNGLPGNTVSLLEWIIRQQIANSNELADKDSKSIGANLIKQFLSYLYVSNTGLLESELNELLSVYSMNGNIAALIRQLRPFLTLQGELLNFFHDDIKKAIFNVYILHAETTSLHAALADYFYSKADPKRDGSFNSNSLRAFRQLLYHTLQSDNAISVVNLINSGFLEPYRKLELPGCILRTIREVVEFLCKKAEGSTSGEEKVLWQAGLHALRIYSNTAELAADTDADQPSLMERAISEGRDEDAVSLLRAANDAQNACMRAAAAVLYRAAGREEAAQNIAEADHTGTPNLLHQSAAAMLFPALISSETTPPEAVQHSKKEAQQSHERADASIAMQKVKPQVRIPPLHLLALNILGGWKYWYAVFFMIIGVALVTLTPLNLMIWADRVKVWAKDYWAIVNWLHFLCQALSGLILIAVPLFILFLIYRAFETYINRHALGQICSMIAYARETSFEKRTQALMRLTRYCRLLNEAKILRACPAELTDVLIEHIRNLIPKKRFDLAGSLFACSAISGIGAGKCILDVTRSLSNEDKKEVLLQMLSCKAALLHAKRTELLELVFNVYGNAPPVAVLSAVLSLNCKDDGGREVIQLLCHVDKSVLAVCLLRSKIVVKPSQNQIRKFVAAEKKVKDMLLAKVAFSVEPVRMEWYDVLIRLLLFLMPLSIAALLICTCCFFGATFIFAVGFPIASLIVTFRLSSIWDEYNETPSDPEAYYQTIFTKQNSEKSKGKFHISRNSAAVETALTNLLVEKPSEAKKIIPGCAARERRKILISAVRLSSENLCRLLPVMLDAGDSLPAVLSCIEQEASTAEKHKKIPLRKDFKRQWKTVRPLRAFPLSAFCMGSLSALLCAGILYILYLLHDPWLQLLIRKDAWILLLLSFVCVLLPLRKLSGFYLFMPVPVFFAIAIVFSDDGILRPNYGAFIFYFLPISVTLLAHQVFLYMRGRRLLFPTKREELMERLKAVLCIIFGSLGIIASIYFILLCNSGISGLRENPEKSKFYTLQNYSIVRLWPTRPGSLEDANVGDRLYTFFTGRSVNQYNLLRRVKDSFSLNKTSVALAKSGYNNEAAICRKKLMNYVGWADAYTIQTNGKNQLIFLDDKKKQIHIAYIITDISLNLEADKLGLREGDAIIAVNGQTFTTFGDLFIYLAANKTPAKITINRNGRNIDYILHSDKIGIAVGVIDLKMISGQDRAIVSISTDGT